MRVRSRINAALGSLAALTIAITANAALADPVRVTIDSGLLAGTNEAGVATFKGVPFAGPAGGANRWAPPQPVAPWLGERAATTFGPACIQPMHQDGSPNEGGASGPTSEDCLTLNIFAPIGARKAPVMVWIYGGANIYGRNAISAYDGSAFARDGVILIAVNYRLGALGFFAHPALTQAAAGDAPLGDYGLMDQIAALKWVQRNIKAFGGDPSNVTVFGESAGGQDTLSLMSIPSARGLFARAIVESGGGWAEPLPLAAAEAAGVKLAVKLGAPDNATQDQLRAIPASALATAGGRYGPIVDGRLMPETATQAFANGDAMAVPLIIGSNSFEASLLASFHIPAEVYLSTIPSEVKAAYPDALTPQAKAYAIFTDAVMGAPARWIAGKAKGPAWLYYFSFRRAAYQGIYPGAPHASEIPFVFDSWDKIDPQLSRGVATKADRALTMVMHACWVAFAKTGKPDCPTPQPWPVYTTGRDQLMEFGDSVGVRTDFRRPQLDVEQTSKASLLAGR